ncbi:GNAT family N-acetyltransferase [Pontibacter oryzae]|uniref:GNAT family N-acetyltransferase n=1 Tax=Pontibacter oryzae TaxID=2304593 RepID=A0A399SK72_9BACT|nr:GNAT family N-acetyltransferase [Pontibacter oryzae]RIJ42307.1 GNAT family N-acetyltransferase [Pontibacter oryzae]
MSKNDILFPELKTLASDNSLIGSLELITGGDVLKIMESSKFLAEWGQLYEVCPWGTVFQSPDYVKCWYQCFGDKHNPILVVARQESALTGVLPLAENIKGLGIAGAGGWSAYYHTWLATPTNGNTFIAAALDLIRQNYPNQDIFFKYLPPQTPTKWFQENQAWAKRSVIRLFTRPILNFSHPSVDKLLNKKQFKSNYNKFKRMGAVQFSTITDVDEFTAVLNTLANFHDFRKGYMFRTMPFRENPALKRYLFGLFKKGLLELNALRVNGELVAGATTIIGKNKCMHGAGINAHSPVYYRFGPSFLALNLVSLKLKAEGYDYLDLTPGGHKYKERHANAHEDIVELRITSKNKAFLLNNFFVLKEVVKEKLAKHSIDPRTLHQRFNKSLLDAATKAGHALGILKLFQKKVSEKPKFENLVYKFTPGSVYQNQSIPIDKNNIAHILSYAPNGTGICKWEFMQQAKSNFDHNSVAYSYAENGVLQFLIWHIASSAKQVNGSKQHHAEPLLMHLYCHSKAINRLPLFLVSVFDELCKEQSCTGMYLQGMNFSARLKKELRLEGKAVEEV